MKKLFALLLVALCCFGFWSATNEAYADVKYHVDFKTAKAKLNTTDRVLYINNKLNAPDSKFTLTATVNVASIAVKSTSWKSSNTAVATVSSKGVVTAKKPGTTTITFTAKRYMGKALTATCKVTVGDGTFTLSSSSAKLNLKSSTTITLKATMNYTKKADSNITWSTSNSKVATVSSSGKVTAKGVGTCTITATHKVLKTKATCKVMVSAKLALKVPNYKQYDKTWKDIVINKSDTIGRSGCTLTCFSMVYSYDKGKSITPDKMRAHLRFNNSDCLIYSSAEKLGYKHKSFSTGMTQSLMKDIYKQLSAGNPVIIGAKNSNKGQHWCVITGYTADTNSSYNAKYFTINDPGSSNRKTLKDFLNTFPTITDMFY